MDIIKRQAIVNDGIRFVFRRPGNGKFETTEFFYENGIVDHVKEMAGEDALTARAVLADGAQGARPRRQAGVPHQDQCGRGLFQPQ